MTKTSETAAALTSLPNLSTEWHPTRNGNRTPADFRVNSREKVWWVCDTCGHEWAAQVYSRAKRGSGCPACWHVRKGELRATPKPGQSFGDLHPDIAKEWHPARNGDVVPTSVRPASNKKVWWRCEMGHEWFVAPAHRLRGERCPECSKNLSAIKRSTPEPGQSLADLYPHFAAEWHPTKNAPTQPAEVNPGSKLRRWWQCLECGSAWLTDPDHRTRRGDGCPKCSMKRMGLNKSIPKPGESLAEKNPELAAEWHPTLNDSVTPLDVRPRGRAYAWWLCRAGHEWRAKIAPRAVGIGCPLCSIIGVSEREVRLAYELEAAGVPVVHEHPRIKVGGRRPVKADIVAPGINLIVEYDGSYYHADSDAKDRRQTKALSDAGWTVLRVREEPLPSLGGHEVSVGSTESIKSVATKVLRKLDRMNYPVNKLAEYLDDPELRAERAANIALNKLRTRSLATEHPWLAAQFDIEANNGIRPESVHPGSLTKFWWRCEVCNHCWRASVATRIAPRGCPQCGIRKRTAARQKAEPGESFADLLPEIAAEWHPTKNAGLTPDQFRPASNVIVWWQCKRDHEWQARIATRREFGRCRECGRIDGTLRRNRKANRVDVAAPQRARRRTDKSGR